MVFVWCRREIESNNKYFYLFVFISLLHQTKTMGQKHLFLIVLYVSLYRWAHFSRAVLCCQPHQQLFTHSLLLQHQQNRSLVSLYQNKITNIFKNKPLILFPLKIGSLTWRHAILETHLLLLTPRFCQERKSFILANLRTRLHTFLRTNP